MQTNIFRVQAYNSILYGYFCIGAIDYMLAGKTLIDHTGLFSPPHDFEKNNNFKPNKKLMKHLLCIQI